MSITTSGTDMPSYDFEFRQRLRFQAAQLRAQYATATWPDNHRYDLDALLEAREMLTAYFMETMTLTVDGVHRQIDPSEWPDIKRSILRVRAMVTTLEGE